MIYDTIESQEEEWYVKKTVMPNSSITAHSSFLSVGHKILGPKASYRSGGFIWIILPGGSPSVGEIWTGTQAGA